MKRSKLESLFTLAGVFLFVSVSIIAFLAIIKHIKKSLAELFDIGPSEAVFLDEKQNIVAGQDDFISDIAEPWEFNKEAKKD